MRRIAIVLSLLLVCRGVTAQQVPALERGFSPEKVYHFGDIDAVNTFNGNLTVNIPLGPTYPVNGALSYSLSLVFNSKVWDYEQLAGKLLAVPARRANAGMGWLVSLGRMIRPDDPTNTSNSWVYESPDAHEHQFFLSPHDNVQPPTFSLPITDVGYTRDSSYIRRIE